MKIASVLAVVVGVSLLSASVQAKDVSQTGTIVAMNSVNCGTKAGGKKTTELLCQEYVLRAGSTEYHIQQKQAKSSDILALQQQATFTLHKNQMRLHATNTSGKAKDYDFVVVSMNTIEGTNPPSAPQQ
jgi:hypothetical protein